MYMKNLVPPSFIQDKAYGSPEVLRVVKMILERYNAHTCPNCASKELEIRFVPDGAFCVCKTCGEHLWDDINRVYGEREPLCGCCGPLMLFDGLWDFQSLQEAQKAASERCRCKCHKR